MIIKQLEDYYYRQVNGDNKAQLAPAGFDYAELKFIIEIDRQGRFVNLADVRNGKRGTSYLVPQPLRRSGKNSWQIAFPLWDHTGYVCARVKSGGTEAQDAKNEEMASNQNQSFIKSVALIAQAVPEDEGVQAVLKFYETEELDFLKQNSLWEECRAIDGCNVTFRLAGENALVCQSSAVRAYLGNQPVDASDGQADTRCIVSGEVGEIARLHNKTPLQGGQATAALISFQKNSGYDSYGKQQAFNAPISQKTMTAYTTALNHLIRSDSNSLQIGDMKIVFWAAGKVSEAGEILENTLKSCFDSSVDDPDKGTIAVKGVFDALKTGKFTTQNNERFCILGMRPNSGRIAICLWEECTVGTIAQRIAQHYEDLEIAHGPKDLPYLPLWQVLTATALADKMKNVIPNLSASVMDSVLTGTPYSMSLYQQTMRRVRALQGPRRKHAAVLKACLNRWARKNMFDAKEVMPMLDVNNPETAYQLGRVFAVLEKIQEESAPGLNATIRDRYYGAVSTSPVTVLPQLLKLKSHHVAKLSEGRKIYFERELGKILDKVSVFPAQFNLQQQGYFALGYYHQRQWFFTSNEDKALMQERAPISEGEN
ncbi:MAG: type I-C CRISPR-associated protein Cas8c/Csd1 [Raoultibacter sp.]